MTRLRQILIAILVVQLALAAFLLWPRPAPAGAGGQPLLGEIKAADITSLAVRDDQGNSIKLAKVGGQWVLPEGGEYPADSTKITPLLDKLVALKGNRLVAQTPASHKRLQVADDAFQRRLDVSTSDGTTLTLFVGSSAGARASHARVAGRNEVYLVDNLVAWDLGADPASWVNPVYLSIPPADVSAVTLRNANGDLSLVKDAQGNWTMPGLAAGETLSTKDVESFVNAVTSVRLLRPLGKSEDPAYGLAQPAALVTILAKTGDQGKTYTLAVGAQDPDDKSYVVKSSESPYYVRVAEYTAQDWLQRTREGFPQATLTPGVTPVE
jgi:hypothetical protein